MIRYLLLRVCLSSVLSYFPPNCSSSKRHTKSHTLCRRCGSRSFHRQHKGSCPGVPTYPLRPSLSNIDRVRAVRIPLSQDPVVRVGPEGQAPKDHWYRPHALPQGRITPLQERLPVCFMAFLISFADMTYLCPQGEHCSEKARQHQDCRGMSALFLVLSSLVPSTLHHVFDAMQMQYVHADPLFRACLSSLLATANVWLH